MKCLCVAEAAICCLLSGLKIGSVSEQWFYGNKR